MKSRWAGQEQKESLIRHINKTKHWSLTLCNYSGLQISLDSVWYLLSKCLHCFSARLAKPINSWCICVSELYHGLTCYSPWRLTACCLDQSRSRLWQCKKSNQQGRWSDWWSAAWLLPLMALPSSGKVLCSWFGVMKLTFSQLWVEYVPLWMNLDPMILKRILWQKLIAN